MLDFFKRNDFGLVPDPEQDNDPRNLRYEDIAPLGGAEYTLTEVDLTESGYFNLNQGKTSACTCFGLVHSFDIQTGVRLSPRYAFSKIKTDPKYRSSQLSWGAYAIDPIKLLINEGIQEYDVTYDEKDTVSDGSYIKPPSKHQKKIQGGSFVYVTNSSDNLERWHQVCRYLAQEVEPVLVAVSWASSFNNARKGGVVPAVTPTGKFAGHLMCATAVKQIRGEWYVVFENSFGEAWGDKGRIWLPIRFVKISSAFGYLAPGALDVKKPEPVADRKIHLEKAKAEELRALIYEEFPDVADVKANANNMAARGLAGRMWLVLVQAITYRGYTARDVINWMYAQSRGKTTTKAYSFDFSKDKK